MIGLSVLMVSVLFRLFIGRFPFLRVAVAVSAVLLLSVGFADVDRFVAGYNVQAYRDGNLPEVDVEHLGSLSVSAVPEVARLLDDADPAVAESARKVMERWFIRMAGPEFHVEGGVVVDERGFRFAASTWRRNGRTIACGSSIPGTAAFQKRKPAAEWAVYPLHIPIYKGLPFPFIWFMIGIGNFCQKVGKRMFLADLHIHSRYSRATSRDCVPEHLEAWARRKGPRRDRDGGLHPSGLAG